MVESHSKTRTGRLGHPIVRFDEVDSTNSVALSLARAGGKEGTLVLADSQSRGRGRMGRIWHSPKGKNLYLSLILHPTRPLHQIPYLVLAAGISVAQTIEQYSGLPGRVKWPNDVMVFGKKVAGILIEQSIQSREINGLVLGIGVNLNMGTKEIPMALRDVATSVLIERGKRVNRQRFLGQLIQNIEAWYLKFDQSSFESIRKEYLGLFDSLGQSIKIHRGEIPLLGRAIGLGRRGGLLVEERDGKQVEVDYGDLFGGKDDVAGH